MRLRSRLLAWCCALAAFLILAPSALAQDDAPQVDPDSPAGTEYELPLDRAREEARSGSATPFNPGTPLFGEGVGDQGSSRSDSETNNGSQSERGELTVTKSERAQLREQASLPDGGGSPILAIGAAATAVLLIGGLGGLAWRRRLSGR